MRMLNRLLILVVIAALAGCAAQPREDTALDNLRADLALFRDNTELSSLVPLALADAERAVRQAGLEGLI